MLPIWNASFRTSLLSVGAEFFKCWIVLTLTGLPLYFALSVFISRKSTGRGVMAVACVTAALAVLLTAEEGSEEGSNDSQVDVANMTLAGCAYLLLAKRKIALGIAVFAIAGGVVGAYYIISSLVRVEYQGSGGTLVIKMPGQTVYYRPLQPYGWENTHIILEDKQTFEVEITGRVSPGLGREISQISTAWEQTWCSGGECKLPALKLPLSELKFPLPQLRFPLPQLSRLLRPKLELPKEVLWDFSGPEGYDEDFYKTKIKNFPGPFVPHYRDDNLLTVRGRHHNEVIGVIVPKGERACRKRPKEKDNANIEENPPCTGTDVEGQPGYYVDNDEDSNQLYLLSKSPDKYPLKVTAKKSGTLWLTINDADLYRYDNVGFFFVKVTTR